MVSWLLPQRPKGSLCGTQHTSKPMGVPARRQVSTYGSAPITSLSEGLILARMGPHAAQPLPFIPSSGGWRR
ncbi:hypothetical protein [Cyanobium sp. Morenito 9A2]|uniref:hypothetical protein n=1 Tax=Cyanobium sp. Morenito 9A2 TaxID=2823718 RepID=UPI0020CF9B38|nr:hypothetical protein [Cyanobium sp. Morenito 9A2]MCP9851097.1 hypothetical protein [Cyanobium sp. Morenito 9A2]